MSLGSIISVGGLNHAEASDFESSVVPFLTEHCLDCHDSESTKGDIQLDDLSGGLTSEASVAIWLKVLDQLQADLMPPEKKTRPEWADRIAVIQWIETELDKSGNSEAYRRKLLLPEYGNWVDHDLLFNGSIKTPAYSHSRLWRLSPEIYARNQPRNTTVPFTYSTKDSDFRDYATSSLVDQSTIETIIVTVNQWLEEEIFKVRGGKKKVISFNQGENKFQNVEANPKHRYAPFILEKKPTDAQMTRMINEGFLSIYRRGPTKEERSKYLKFLEENIADGGNLKAMKATALAMRLSPEAIFRMELGLGDPDEHGRRRLSQPETAYAVAYALTDRGPFSNQAISEALKNGKLGSREEVASLVEGMLKEVKPYDAIANPRIIRFFAEYFGYRGVEEVFKDDERQRTELGFPLGTNGPKRMIEDVENWIRLIVARDENVLETILTSDEFLISHNGDNDKAKKDLESFYSSESLEKSNERQRKRMDLTLKNAEEMEFTPFPGNTGQIGYVRTLGFPHQGAEGQRWSWPVEQPVEVAHRKGILTHPAWLWAHSTNFDNDPIHRGIWVYTKLLAGVIPDVPPDVDAQVPEDPHKTLRQRLDVVRASECWKCHRKINPLGETFEIFDDFGRFRDRLYFDQNGEIVKKRDAAFERLRKEGVLTERSIDSTGELRHTGDPALDGSVGNAFELIDRIAQSDRARQSFVRHAFRYFMGRNEVLSDSQTLIAADQAYLESNGSFHALVISILSSDSFLYRK
tara:strand:+ start:1458 stop:3704 length:2247 start_codon:yes stop_codon:yes gene_type:complete